MCTGSQSRSCKPHLKANLVNIGYSDYNGIDLHFLLTSRPANKESLFCDSDNSIFISAHFQKPNFLLKAYVRMNNWMNKRSDTTLKLINGPEWVKIVCVTFVFIFFTFETYALVELSSWVSVPHPLIHLSQSVLFSQRFWGPSLCPELHCPRGEIGARQGPVLDESSPWEGGPEHSVFHSTVGTVINMREHW